jgi:polysaccharide export outer membrane protein
MNRMIHLIGMAVALAGLMSGCATMSASDRRVKPYRPVLERDVTRPAPKPAVARKPPVAPAPALAQAPATHTPAEPVLDQAGRVLRRGDRLKVVIHAPPEPFPSEQVVDELGRINLPFIGSVIVADRTCGDAQSMIEKAYIEQKYYKQVTVIIVPPESEYSVAGEVIRPGSYPLTRDLTLLQALARAGRYTEYADQGKVYLIRENQRVEIKLDDIRKNKRKDVVIIPGDIIEVPRTWY